MMFILLKLIFVLILEREKIIRGMKYIFRKKEETTE